MRPLCRGRKARKQGEEERAGSQQLCPKAPLGPHVGHAVHSIAESKWSGLSFPSRERHRAHWAAGTRQEPWDFSAGCGEDQKIKGPMVLGQAWWPRQQILRGARPKGFATYEL